MPTARRTWTLGDRLAHRHNPDLGVGRVVEVQERAVVVEFPDGTRLRLAEASDALVAVAEEDPGPLDPTGALVERLAAGEVDPLADFAIRLDALHLAALREAGGLGSFLGGRVRLFPHQLHTAERASAADPVRWLLADEVGLGKTVEACLILNRLVRTGRVERCLIVAPETLTVQWLGEMWRKYHQVFALLDEDRLADVARDFGPDFNPFDVHRRAVIALETLIARPRLTEQAVAAGIDLMVVDEAHRLRRPPGHAGDRSWRAVAPIAGLGRHVLLLTATPFEDDVHGFFRLLQLLRPDEFPDEEDFEARLSRADPLPPCTSSTRRAEIGGLPPRVALPVAAADAGDWTPRLGLEDVLRRAPARDPVSRRLKIDRIRRGLGSGAALAALLASGESALKAQAEAADAVDPRVDWLMREARAWKEAGQKTLVFAAHRETLEMLRTAFTNRAQLATGVFHESLTSARRDIEVAQFRRPEGPSLLVSTECGGEGRNFEFCHRLVLFDLPWNPVVVEQRIGRLDRIGRRRPVEIVYFRPPAGIGAEAVRLLEAIGVFREPLAGLEPQLAHIENALDEAALEPEAVVATGAFDALVTEASIARARIREAAYHELHRDRYGPELAEGILARIPPDLDALNEDVTVAACERLGFEVERQRGRRGFAITFGNQAIVDSLPGVPGGSSFLGTFDREEAVFDETLDFFASGHALVEGVLAHLEESPLGRVGVLHVGIPGARGFALLALYKEGPVFDAVVIDAEGRPRPDWAAALVRRPLRSRRVPAERMRDADWAPLVRQLAAHLDLSRRPAALAAVILG
jgi:ATP-dependent helicase HepA